MLGLQEGSQPQVQLLTPADKASVRPGWDPTFCQQMEKKEQNRVRFLSLSETVRKNKERGREVEVGHVGDCSRGYSSLKPIRCQAPCSALYSTDPFDPPTNTEAETIIISLYR